jgi:hypothetical protein
MRPDAPSRTARAALPLMDLTVPQKLETACFAFG